MKSAGIYKRMKKYFALFLVLAMILGTSGNSARAVTLSDEAGSAATATDAPKECSETDGFSYYNVEFTYNEKQYVMQGDSEVALTDILDFVGITKADGSAAANSDISAVSVSNEALFSASNESGEWLITAHQAFTSTEWMKVTVDGTEYEIVVTDATYTSNKSNLSWNSGDIFVSGYTYSFGSSGNYYVSYNGDPEGSCAQGVSVTIATDGKITYSRNGETHTQTLPAGCNAWQLNLGSSDYGTGRISVYYFTGTNYVVKDASCSTSNKTYNGSSQTGVTGSNVTLTGTISATEVGSYTAYATPISGHAWSDGTTSQRTVTWKIDKAMNTLSYTSTQSVTKSFSTSSQTATLAAATNGIGTVSYEIDSQKNSSGSAVSYFSVNSTTGTSLTIAANTPAGIYTVVVKVSATGNNHYYEDTRRSTVTVTINPLAMTVTSDGYTGTYDGNSHGITVSAPAGATVKYGTANGTYNLATNPTYKDAGTYTVYYQVTKDNYQTVEGSAKVQIAPKELTLTWDRESAFTYNGLLQAPGAYISGVIGNDGCTVNVDGAKRDYSSEAYTAKAVLNGEQKNNYSLPSDNTKEFTIGKKDVTITAADQTVTYGTAITQGTDEAAADGLVSGDSLTKVILTQSTSDYTAEGSITPSDAEIKNASGEVVTDNYSIAYVPGLLVIDKKVLTITADDDTKVYDGTALTKDSFEADGLTDGDSIESIAVTGSQTNAGKCDNVPDEAVIINAAGEDVTANYDITYVNGTLEVTKKEIVISGISAVDKIYDGTADAELDYSGIDWSACGMVDGDELSVTADCSFEDANAGNDKTVELSDITLDGESVDNYILAEDGQQTETYADIIKKAVTVTALKQTVAINGRIIDSVDYSELIDAIEGHELSEITLTSGSTKEVTAEGVITPSDAKILDDDIDVTDNYDITYIDGVMTVIKAEAEVVLDNSDAEEVCVTEAEVPNLIELAESEAEEGRLVKVELSVKTVSEDEIDELTVSDIKAAAENIFVDTGKLREKYLKIDLTKYIDDERIGSISDAGMPLEIILTCNTSITDNPVVIRNHEGAVEVFKRLAARPSGSFTDATYYVEGDKIYMYSQYFSDFAIAYSIEKTFNVSLDDGNGNIIRQIVPEGTKFTPPTDLTRDGYDFGGWYKDEAHTQKWDPDKDKVTSDIELYARWVKKEVPSDTSASMTDNPAEKAADANASAKLTDKKSLISKSPATGDGAKSGIAGMLMVISFMAAMYLMFRRRSR